MVLDDVKCDAEENLEVVWAIIAGLTTIAYNINAVCMLLVVRLIDFALLHSKVRE